MSKKTTKRLITLIISFLVIIFLQFALSSPGAEAQSGIPEGAKPVLKSGIQDGLPGTMRPPANLAGQVVSGAEQSGAEQTASPTALAPGWNDILKEDFEGAWPGSWDLRYAGLEQLWGPDNYKPHMGSYSAWPAKGGAQGISAGYNLYPNNMNSWMIYGPFDLSDATKAEVEFWLWREIEEGPDPSTYYDALFVGVSGDGQNFNFGDGGYWWGFQKQWTYYLLDFADLDTNFFGDSSVYFAIAFTSDSDINYEGPFVDDIVLRKYIPDPPTADFSGTPTSGTKPLTVNFTDQSTGSINSWLWDFGDGGSSTQANPSHSYTTAGQYTVKLTVSGPDGSDSKTRTNYINVTEPAPVADFSATPLSGTNPLDVSFTNQSTGVVSSYSWDFGDGGSSTQANPGHSYTTAGQYTVKLTVSGPGGSNSKTRTNYINVSEPNQPPVADFSATPLFGGRPLNVSFTNLSTGDISTYAWSFGDGGSSTQPNPSHEYTANGSYTVSLTVSGPGGSNTKTQTNYISVTDPEPAPVADFSGTPVSGLAPLTVKFSDLSSGNITSWSWDFGDGGSSAQGSPSHTYTTAGDYTVKLTVTGPGGSNSKTRNNYIHVVDSIAPPVADFSASPLSGINPLIVGFNDLSSGNISSWLWNFGDGGTSTESRPVHKYETAGDYTVKLTVTGPGGSDSKTRTNYIHVDDPTPPPVANFTSDHRVGDAPFTVKFTDQSSGNITGWSWDFGDDGSSAQKNPSHTYTVPGVYRVSLTVSGPTGSNTKLQNRYIHVMDPTTTLDLMTSRFSGLEVTQGIQDLTNSVRLVANKRTYVRFHTSANYGNHVGEAVLLAQRAGYANKFLFPINTSTVGVLESPNRGHIDHSFLFELPDGYREGKVTLTAELNFRKKTKERSYSNNTATYEADFETVPTLNLVLYSVGYGYGEKYYPSWIHREKIEDWLRRAYPVSDIKIIHRVIDYGDSIPKCEQVLKLLTTQRLKTDANKLVPANAHYFGMVDDGGGFMRGCAYVPGFEGTGPVGVDATTWNAKHAWDTDGSYGDWYTGHELGHSYGRPHIADRKQEIENDDGVKVIVDSGPCKAEGGQSFPNPDGRISRWVGTDFDYYGFDIHTKEIYGPGWHDVMSYCANQWISEWTYEHLMSFIQKPPLIPYTVNREIALVDRLLVVGTIDPASQEVDLAPLFIIPNAADHEPATPGPYAIVLRNAAGVELARYPFTPDSVGSGPGPAGEPDINLLGISELVPYVGGTSRVDIEHEGLVLATVTAGATAPTVTVTTPNGGETLAADTIHVTWTAGDSDGDPLVFNVLYSADGGQEWETVAYFLTGTEVDIDAANIAGSDQALFRVEVSDGIHTAHDDSDATFTVPNRVPAVAILEPANGATFVISQTVGLRASAFDVDTGTMVDKQLQWSSNRDGALGSGKQLSFADLSQGVHTITFRADDGQGGVAEEQVEITILAEAPTPADKLVAGPTTVILSSVCGLPNPILSLTNQNFQKAIGWTAVTSEPWLKLSAKSGTTPANLEVSFDAAGLDPDTYTAEITFTSPATPGNSAIVPVTLEIVENGDCAVYLPITSR